jgi:MIP family channel proteins
VAIGAGAAAHDSASGGAFGPLGRAIVPGLVVMVCVHALGRASGTHFNPAVTVALVASGELPSRRAPSYVLSQTLGAIAGAVLISAIYGSAGTGAATRIGAGAPAWVALLAEIAGTAILMTAILVAATESRTPSRVIGLLIGGGVIAGIVIADSISGGSLNPARSFGPALVFGAWDSFWVYLVGPTAGAVLVSLCYRRLRRRGFHRHGAHGIVPWPGPPVEEDAGRGRKGTVK